jgi:hypothetical protein
MLGKSYGWCAVSPNEGQNRRNITHITHEAWALQLHSICREVSCEVSTSIALQDVSAQTSSVLLTYTCIASWSQDINTGIHCSK